jgi:hypothetical protein
MYHCSAIALLYSLSAPPSCLPPPRQFFFYVYQVVDGVEVYAYEVDGLGNSLVDFDDPNLPSLMSIPLLGYQHFDQRVYDVTRERLFAHNKYYVRCVVLDTWARQALLPDPLPHVTYSCIKMLYRVLQLQSWCCCAPSV